MFIFSYIIDYYIYKALKEYKAERKSGDTLRKLYFFINFRRVSRCFLKISYIFALDKFDSHGTGYSWKEEGNSTDRTVL